MCRGPRALARAFTVLALLVGLGSGCLCVRANLRAVEPNAFYRSGQLSPAALQRIVKRRGIRTVINLRGATPHESWYREERDRCAALGIAHHDFSWSRGELPPPGSLAAYMHTLDAAERPVLVHCNGGTHRAAVAAACHLLSQGAPIEQAREQLGLFFNDAPIGGLLDLYEGSPMAFRAWVTEVYPSRYKEVRAPKP